jgi:hypothetical protein
MNEGTPVKQYILKSSIRRCLTIKMLLGLWIEIILQLILLLCLLPDSYDNIRAHILYGTYCITMDDITSILLSKDLLTKSHMESRQSEGLVVRMGCP